MTQDGLGWGIVATGGIAAKFADDLAHVAGARRAAVCSRSQVTGREFAHRHGFARVHDEFDAFLADPEVRIVYIASPNVAHVAQALAAIEAGKPVVIEKPVAMTAAEARRIAAAAAERKVFATEALWTRFLPAVQRAKALIDDGAIGAVERAEAELCYHRSFDPANRLYDPKLGGGALHDLGVYPLSLALMLFGDAQNADGSWTPSPTGTDMTAQVALSCGGVSVRIRAGFDREGENAFVVYGSKGTLRIDRHFLAARSLTLWGWPMKRAPRSFGGLLAKVRERVPLDGRKTERFDFPGHGLSFEARSAQAAVLAGETASAVMPLAQSVRALEIIEAVLAKPASG